MAGLGMRLLFPNGEHAPVELPQGETGIGQAAENAISAPDSSLAAYHAAVLTDAQRGVWLRVDARDAGAHVNARPVREIAMLRVGDLVTLGSLQMLLGHSEDVELSQSLPSLTSPSADPARRAAASRVVLRGIAGAAHGRALPLTDDIHIGSAQDAVLRLDGAGIEPRHASLELREEGILLRSNGGQSRVNGVTVRDAVLHPGDQIVIGSHRFVLEAPGMVARDANSALRRGSTYTITAVTTPLPLSPPPQPQSASVAPAPETGSGFNYWWLLFAAVAIAVVFVAILLFAKP